MIDDIKDLTEHQKRKRERHQELTSAFLKTFVLMIVAAVGMALFGIFTTSDFQLTTEAIYAAGAAN